MNDSGKYETVLREKGYKLTEQRKLIIEVFKEKPGNHTAQEIFDFVKKKSKGINFSTIYRNLELLRTLEIINKLYIENGISHYELCGREYHHYIICKCCGEMREIDMCPYVNLGEEQLRAMGFNVTDYKFEIFGYCSKCSLLKK